MPLVGGTAGISPSPPSGLALALILLAACGGGSDGGDGGNGDGGGGAAVGTEVLVELVEVGGSGQTGTVTLTASADGTMVTVETVSYLVDPQPTHIHRGTCADLEAEPAVPLATIEDGISVTTIELGLDELQAGGYAVDVHESETKDAVVACGEIAAGG
jgi:hypothetical protein